MLKSNIPAEKAVGFEIYHFPFDANRNRALADKYADIGFMNQAPLSHRNLEYGKLLAEKGIKFWIYANAVLYSRVEDGKRNYYIKDNYRELIAEQVATLKEAGLWDYVIGFDYDEPMLQSTNELVLQATEEYAKYGKRIRAIFSYYEIIEGSHPSSNDPEFGKEGHLINPDSCKYFTDVGFDWYGKRGYKAHKRVLDEMKRRVGRDDVYIWLLPCTWSAHNRFSEEHCIKHLETCYRLLKAEKHPGGLSCYNWYSFGPDGAGLDWLLADENISRWAKLEKRMIEIGTEITSWPLK